MSGIKLTILFAVLLTWLSLAGTGCSPPVDTAARSDIPYVPTRHDTVQDLLRLADVNTNDVVYDLGSGDGRVVIAAVRDFHAQRGVGIELNEKLVRESRSNAVAAGVADRVQFIQGDLFTNDFSAASVVVLYLGHFANLDLRLQIIRSLKPGARVASHQFGMGEWVRDKFLDVPTDFHGMYGTGFYDFADNPDVPDFGAGRDVPTHVILRVWTVPAPVAGVWRGKMHAESGEAELRLVLHQKLSGISGSFQLQGNTNLSGYLNADLKGGKLHCRCIATNAAWIHDQILFDGNVQGNNLIGDLRMRQGFNVITTQWTAHRDQTNFTGTWEWTGPSNAPVQLKIERPDNRLVLTYTDKNPKGLGWVEDIDTKPISVSDTYDFGGGFYFTLLLGAEPGSFGRTRSQRPQDGWLIGEAIMDDGALKGTLTFYPYPFFRQQTPGTSTPPFDRLNWMPKRVAP